MKRTVTIGVLAIAMVLESRVGVSQPESKPSRSARHHAARGCNSAYRNALKLEQKSQLTKAKKFLRTCAKTKCGVFLQHQCTWRYGQIDGEMPSVVPLATDEHGAAVVDVKLKVDGALLATRLDGHSVPVDPGLHVFSFENHHGVVRRQVMVLQGQRNRQLTVTLRGAGAPPHLAARRLAEVAVKGVSEKEVAAEEAAEKAVSTKEDADDEAPPALVKKTEAPAHKKKVEEEPEPDDEDEQLTLPAPAPQPARELPNKWFSTGSYILLGTGVAGLAGYGLFSYWGRQDNEDLAACTPNCPQSSLDHIENLYTAANISMGVGVAALLGGTYLVWRQHSKYSLEVQAMQSGAVATLSGAF